MVHGPLEPGLPHSAALSAFLGKRHQWCRRRRLAYLASVGWEEHLESIEGQSIAPAFRAAGTEIFSGDYSCSYRRDGVA